MVTDVYFRYKERYRKSPCGTELVSGGRNPEERVSSDEFTYLKWEDLKPTECDKGETLRERGVGTDRLNATRGTVKMTPERRPSESTFPVVGRHWGRRERDMSGLLWRMYGTKHYYCPRIEETGRSKVQGTCVFEVHGNIFYKLLFTNYLRTCVTWVP